MSELGQSSVGSTRLTVDAWPCRPARPTLWALCCALALCQSAHLAVAGSAPAAPVRVPSLPGTPPAGQQAAGALAPAPPTTAGKPNPPAASRLPAWSPPGAGVFEPGQPTNQPPAGDLAAASLADQGRNPYLAQAPEGQQAPSSAPDLEARVQQLEAIVRGDQPAQMPLAERERMDVFERNLNAFQESQKAGANKLPLIKLGGFFQLDDGLFSQSPNSVATLGRVYNGVGFRRTRLQAYGNVTEFTAYIIEVDFAIVGRPSFLDVWAEQQNLPFFGAVRIGHFRQPTSMDGWTSIRHLEFLERSLPFQAFDPFRRTGIMSQALSEDERWLWAYSVFATGFTFFNGASTVYGTNGDSRFGTEIGNGGVAGAFKLSHLIYYDEPSEGRYLWHVAGSYVHAELGGVGTTGTFARAYEARSIPEFFVGDPNGGGVSAAGTPWIVDTGRFLANSYNLFIAGTAANIGSAHLQAEYFGVIVNQMNGGPPVNFNGAYLQAGYFLTGEHNGFNRQMGVMDYSVKPFTDFFGIGRKKRMGGWGAWEVAARWSYLDLSSRSILPANYLPGVAGPPPSINPGVVNETTVALNWYWNKNTRVQFNWIRPMLNSNLYGNSTMNIFATRFQVEF